MANKKARGTRLRDMSAAQLRALARAVEGRRCSARDKRRRLRSIRAELGRRAALQPPSPPVQPVQPVQPVPPPASEGHHRLGYVSPSSPPHDAADRADALLLESRMHTLTQGEAPPSPSYDPCAPAYSPHEEAYRPSPPSPAYEPPNGQHQHTHTRAAQ